MKLEISNNNEVNPLAFSLMGVSTKRNDSNTIGEYGSGNKFSVACLLRNKVKFTIYQGLKQIKVTTTPGVMDGQEFDLIVIDGKETSLTTGMGKDWQVWQAIREFYANAVDAGLDKFDYAATEKPEAGKTKIYLELTDEVEEVIINKTDYFAIERKPLAVTPHGKIYRNEGNGIKVYRRGIRCYNGNENSMFDYDFNEIAINESRMLQYSWDLHTGIWQMLFATDCQQIIRKLVTQLNEGKFYETNSINSTWVETRDARDISDGWRKMLAEKHVCSPVMAEHAEPDELKKSYVIPPKLHQILEVRFADEAVEVSPPSFKITGGQQYKEVNIPEVQAKVFEEAMDFLISVNFPITYPVKIVEFIKPNTMGQADIKNKTILMGVSSLDRGVHETVNTLLEEYIHIKHKVHDETRQFQTAVIDEFINYMKTGKALELNEATPEQKTNVFDDAPF